MATTENNEERNDMDQQIKCNRSLHLLPLYSRSSQSSEGRNYQAVYPEAMLAFPLKLLGFPLTKLLLPLGVLPVLEVNVPGLLVV